MCSEAIGSLKWKKIADNFISTGVGKEYDAETYYWTTFYYYRGPIIDTANLFKPLSFLAYPVTHA
jgi:hypothetical protein